mmetsp:Transcript_4552/g.4283  ORF Transcript_4552/g.4283 Transcript_4552/m.4283 type:complete len:82 (+) Transcript_4552:750-995(+)
MIYSFQKNHPNFQQNTHFNFQKFLSDHSSKPLKENDQLKVNLRHKNDPYPDTDEKQVENGKNGQVHVVKHIKDIQMTKEQF